MSHTLCRAESKLLVGSRVPKSSADLAVPKKKVGEVRDWLLADHGPSLLLLSGAKINLSLQFAWTIACLMLHAGYRICRFAHCYVLSIRAVLMLMIGNG